ncbi:allantoin racemase [Nocardioides zeae]|uniref:Allantoin racemase n=2 Tax=Nocardioides zeae TaxID=1457234 RepID=A0AAJ1TWU7_9ACTN|nr:aspartate/glutamate racemase family protein [Nocardioides zeae]MDQ1103780.1 allantoin racemase [Nocardioides zeae]MDR6176511.1 allantoin racemase [Nocardioides zeae]MDR6209523.1 allantoin racemase [Nocardioides zeae]
MNDSRPVRIMYQSFTDPAHHQPYLSRLADHLAEIAGPGVTYEVRGISPADTQLGRLSELRCGVQSVAGIVQAEREGFDGVLVGHFQDACLYEARTAVDIPVVGHGEASMMQACMLGGRVGIITLDTVYLSWHREQVRRYGLQDRVVDVRALQLSPDAAVAANDDPAAYASIRRTFVALAEAMVAESEVDVVMAAGGLFALLSAHDVIEVPGALVANPTLLAVRQAEVAVSLARALGTPVSRGGPFARATPRAVQELMELMGDRR